MSVRTYNPSVRVGNWNEDIQLEEDTLKDFLCKRESGELQIQKTHNLIDNILEKVDLSISRDGYVHFGDVVMIMNEGAADQTKYTSGADPRCTSVVSANMVQNKMHMANALEGPCGVVGSQCHTEPCVRNAFVITSIDGSLIEEPLRFGQAFHLCTTPGAGGELLLFSDRATFNKCAKRTRHQDVSLVNDPSSFLTQWKVEHFNPQLRMEYEGVKVPANEKVVLKHCLTNQALAVEQSARIRTSFGREYEISAHTYLNSHKAEEDVNHMMLVMGMPGDQVYPVQRDDTRLTEMTNMTEMSQ